MRVNRGRQPDTTGAAVLRRDATIVTVSAATVIAASWLPWQENRDSYDFGPAAAVIYHVSGWGGWNPLIATCASCAALIAWNRTIRDSRQKRLAGVVASSCGLGLAASCYVGLVAQSQVRPAIGLGITLVSLALMIAAALWNETRAHACAASWYSKRPSRWCAVALVGLALGMTGYVPPDDPPRSGVGGTRMVGKYLVQYELDDAGITLLIVMKLPDDLLASGGGQQDGRYTWTYSFGTRGPLTLR